MHAAKCQPPAGLGEGYWELSVLFLHFCVNVKITYDTKVVISKLTKSFLGCTVHKRPRPPRAESQDSAVGAICLYSVIPLLPPSLSFPSSSNFLLLLPKCGLEDPLFALSLRFPGALESARGFSGDIHQFLLTNIVMGAWVRCR